MKILVADDELVSRSKMLSLLRPYGQCTPASNGRSALESVRLALEAQEPFDILFLDIDMPTMDGMAVLTEIRGLEAEREVPAEKKLRIVMATGNAEKETIVKCLQEGCNDYILKPVRKEMIAKKMARFFSLDGGAPSE